MPCPDLLAFQLGSRAVFGVIMVALGSLHDLQ